MDTSLVQTPHYITHSLLCPWGKKILTLSLNSTHLIRTLSTGPSVSVLTGFDCKTKWGKLCVYWDTKELILIKFNLIIFLKSLFGEVTIKYVCMYVCMFVCMYVCILRNSKNMTNTLLPKKQYFFSVLFLLINNITCTLPHLIYINKEPLQIHKIHYLHVIMVIKEDWR